MKGLRTGEKMAYSDFSNSSWIKSYSSFKTCILGGCSIPGNFSTKSNVALEVAGIEQIALGYSLRDL